MRKFAHIAFVLLAASACEFRPLQDPGNVSYVRVYLDESNLLNVKEGFYNEAFQHPEYKRPEILRVGLFDTNTGALSAERYLRSQGDDERGHYYDGYIVVNPGQYHFAAYNFGTESTVMAGEYDWNALRATTNPVSPELVTRYKSAIRATDGSKAAEEVRSLDNEVIRYDADVLFASRSQGLTVSPHSGLDTLRSQTGEPWFTASSVVEDYYIQIGIIGSEYVSSTIAILGGMASEVPLSTLDARHSEPTALYYEMHSGVNDHPCIYSTFGTFGRHEGCTNNLLLSFEFTTTYGQAYEVTLDITDEFLKENAILHRWLILDQVITIPEPPHGEEGSGGLAPRVDDWGDVYSDIFI